jgi:hypothetical protein
MEHRIIEVMTVRYEQKIDFPGLFPSFGWTLRACQAPPFGSRGRGQMSSTMTQWRNTRHQRCLLQVTSLYIYLYASQTHNCILVFIQYISCPFSTFEDLNNATIQYLQIVVVAPETRRSVPLEQWIFWSTSLSNKNGFFLKRMQTAKKSESLLGQQK